LQRIACLVVLAGLAVASSARADLFTTSPTLTCFVQNNVTHKLAKTQSKDMSELIADAFSIDVSAAGTVTVVLNTLSGALEVVHRCEGDKVFTFAEPVYCSAQSSPGSQKSVCSFEFAPGGSGLCNVSITSHGAKASASGSCLGPIELLSTGLPCQLQLKIGKPFQSSCAG
jgi:hypothetical protein